MAQNVQSAPNANPTPGGVAPVIELKTIPKDSDTGSNAYVITYRTNKHDSGNGSSQTALDYGPKMGTNNYTREQIEQASFTGDKGDNLMWDTLYWRCTLDGTPIVYKTTMDSKKRGVGVDEQLIVPNKKIRLPGGSILDTTYLRSLPAFPFDENGVLRAATELARDSSGNVSFVDSSDGSGTSVNLPKIEAHVKISSGVAGLDGKGPEFESSDQYRYFNGQTLAAPNGKVDMASPKIIAEVLSKAKSPSAKATPGAPGAQGGSVFEPIQDKNSQRMQAPQAPLGPGMNANNPTGLAKTASDEKESFALNFDDIAKGADNATKSIKNLQDATNKVEAPSTSSTNASIKTARSRVILGYTKSRIDNLL